MKEEKWDQKDDRFKDLFERSGNKNHRPKELLNRIAKLKHRNDSTEFREDVARQTDIEVLSNGCPKGFAPVADSLKMELVDKH